MTENLPATPYIVGMAQSAALSASIGLQLLTWFPLILALGSLLLLWIRTLPPEESDGQESHKPQASTPHHTLIFSHSVTAVLGLLAFSAIKFNLWHARDLFTKQIQLTEQYQRDGAKAAQLPRQQWQVQTSQGRFTLSAQGKEAACVQAALFFPERLNIELRSDVITLRPKTQWTVRGPNDHLRVAPCRPVPGSRGPGHYYADIDITQGKP